LLGLLLLWTWREAARAQLVRQETPPEVMAAICRRIIAAQSLYAFGRAVSDQHLLQHRLHCPGADHYAVAPPWPFRR